jgi:hypothetical protein
MAKQEVDWAKTAADWADEADWLRESEGPDSRVHREAAAFARSAERRAEAESEKQAERDRLDTLTPKQVAREVVDRMLDS